MIQDHKFGANCDQASESRQIWRPGGAIATGFVLVGLVIASTMAIAARAAIVSIAPPTAAAYALAGMPVHLHSLSITDVHATSTQKPQGQGELLVTGEIANLRGSETLVPNLRLILRGEDGRELYAWMARAPKSSLGARERMTFRARLAAPPAGVRDVMVKFAAPGDKGSFTETPS